MERKVAEDKVRHLENYCELNNIRLQPRKWSFIVINKTDDIDYSPIVMKKGKIENTTGEVYLGSTIKRKKEKTFTRKLIGSYDTLVNIFINS